MQKHVTVAVDDYPQLMEAYRELANLELECPNCEQPDFDAFSFQQGNKVGDAEQMVMRVSATCENCEAVIHCEMPHWLWWSDQSFQRNVHDSDFRMLNGETIASAFKRTAGYDLGNQGYSARLR
ncbi:hypothetical protein [Gordonia sp. MMO-8]|uniref:hypothetical protein n=1 Tax=Gordonia sp. MMO-8 TaxID=3127886 RepID=UPI0030179B9F